MNFYYLGLEEGGGRQKDFQISILFLYLKTKAKWIKKHARISILVYVIHIKTKSYADGFCLWENSHKHVILHNGRLNYLEPMAHAWPGVILLPPRWDLSPLQRYPPPPPPIQHCVRFLLQFASTHLYTWMERGTVSERTKHNHFSGDRAWSFRPAGILTYWPLAHSNS